MNKEHYTQLSNSIIKEINAALVDNKEYALLASLTQQEKEGGVSCTFEQLKERLMAYDWKDEYRQAAIVVLRNIFQDSELDEKITKFKAEVQAKPDWQVERTDDIEKAAKAYAEKTYNKLLDKSLHEFAKKDFIAGYLTCLKKGPKKSNEGFTITEDQIAKILELTGKTGSTGRLLQEWFPLAKVFTPEPVYKVGQRFMLEGSSQNIEMLMAGIGSSKAALIRLTNGDSWTTPVKVVDPYAITKEEFELLTAGHPIELIQ